MIFRCDDFGQKKFFAVRNPVGPTPAQRRRKKEKGKKKGKKGGKEPAVTREHPAEPHAGTVDCRHGRRGGKRGEKRKKRKERESVIPVLKLLWSPKPQRTLPLTKMLPSPRREE